jgi:hypothetical protein
LPNRLRFPDLLDLDISLNKIASLPKQFHAPSLRTLKMVGCKVSGHLNISDFPNLAYVDGTRTKLGFGPPTDSTRIVLASNHAPPTPEFQRLSLRSFVSYATSQGDFEVLDDIPLVRHRNGLHFFGLFASRTGGLTSSAVTRAIHPAIPAGVTFDEQSFLAVVNDIMDVYRADQFYDGSDFLFAMWANRELYVASLGAMDLLSVDAKTARVSNVLGPDRDLGSLQSDELASVRGRGDALVFGVAPAPVVRRVAIADGVRFLVFLSSTVVATLTPPLFTALCRCAASARELAYAIRNHAAALTARNVSALVVDTAEGQRARAPERDSSDSGGPVEAPADDGSSSGEGCVDEPVAPVIRARTMAATPTLLDYSSESFSDGGAATDAFVVPSSVSDDFGTSRALGDDALRIASDDGGAGNSSSG